jgi:hypothetical protein
MQPGRYRWAMPASFDDEVVRKKASYALKSSSVSGGGCSRTQLEKLRYNVIGALFKTPQHEDLEILRGEIPESFLQAFCCLRSNHAPNDTRHSGTLRHIRGGQRDVFATPQVLAGYVVDQLRDRGPQVTHHHRRKASIPIWKFAQSGQGNQPSFRDDILGIMEDAQTRPQAPCGLCQ